MSSAISDARVIAAWYIVATGITLIFTYFLARRYGLYGAARSLIISEVIMNFYVLPASLRIAHDTLPDFLASMLHYPQFLKPANMLARLCRSKPTLEAERHHASEPGRIRRLPSLQTRARTRPPRPPRHRVFNLAVGADEARRLAVRAFLES